MVPILQRQLRINARRYGRGAADGTLNAHIFRSAVGRFQYRVDPFTLFALFAHFFCRPSDRFPYPADPLRRLRRTFFCKLNRPHDSVVPR